MNKKHATLEASYEDKPQHFTYSDVQTFMFPCANTNREVRHDQFHEVVNEPDKPIGRGRYTRVDQAHKQSLIYLVTKEGHSIKEASMELGINYSTAKSIIQVHRLQGEAWYEHDEEYQPLPRGRPRKVTAEIIHSIDICRQVNPCISLQGILEYILDRHNLRLCKATIHNYLREIKSSQALPCFSSCKQSV